MAIRARLSCITNAVITVNLPTRVATGDAKINPATAETRLAPGQPAALLPVLVGGLGQLRQLGELRWGQAQGGRGGITLKLLDRDGPGEHDVHPRIGERRPDRDPVLGCEPAVGPPFLDHY